MTRSLLPIALIALVVTGCSGGAKTETPLNQPEVKKPTDAKKELKVALLTPGPVSDAGWSALAYDGLEAIHKDLGAEVNNQEAKDAQIKDAMRSYAQKGYNLIFGHGYEYNDPAIEVAKEFPNTVFISSSGGKTSANVGCFRFTLEEGFFLAGITAGKMTKTKKLAMIGGPDVPSIRSTFKAFKAGALAADPNIEVIEVFTNDGSDVAKAKQATLAAIGQGADFVIHQANAAAQGVFDACKEKGVFAFGANANQNDNPSGVVLASAVIVAKPAFEELAKRVQAGTYQGEVTSIGMSKGAIAFTFNPKLSDKVSPEIRKDIDDATLGIIGGSIKVPMDKF